MASIRSCDIFLIYRYKVEFLISIFHSDIEIFAILFQFIESVWITKVNILDRNNFNENWTEKIQY